MRRLVWLIVAIALSTPCLAQGVPNVGMDMTSTTAPLKPEQVAILEQFTDAHLRDLQSDDYAQAARALQQLEDPIRRPGVTSLFRDEYSRVLTPKLGPVVAQQENHYAAVNAMQLAGQLKTRPALDLAMKHVAQSKEDRAPIRVVAAKAVRLAAMELLKNQVNARAVDAATRDLARAAKEETNWIVLLRQLETLGSINTPIALTEELDVLSAVAKRMAAQDEPSDLIHAVFPAMFSLQRRLIAPDVPMPPTQQAAMGKALAPVCGEVLDVARTHFDSAQLSEGSKQTYGSLVNVAEQTMLKIDAFVAPSSTQRAPPAQLKDSWEKNDKPRFEQGVELWMQRLESPVYKKD